MAVPSSNCVAHTKVSEEFQLVFMSSPSCCPRQLLACVVVRTSHVRAFFRHCAHCLICPLVLLREFISCWLLLCTSVPCRSGSTRHNARVFRLFLFFQMIHFPSNSNFPTFFNFFHFLSHRHGALNLSLAFPALIQCASFSLLVTIRTASPCLSVPSDFLLHLVRHRRI